MWPSRLPRSFGKWLHCTHGRGIGQRRAGHTGTAQRKAVQWPGPRLETTRIRRSLPAAPATAAVGYAAACVVNSGRVAKAAPNDPGDDGQQRCAQSSSRGARTSTGMESGARHWKYKFGPPSFRSYFIATPALFNRSYMSRTRLAFSSTNPAFL